jgi:hypothetical protein
MIDKIRKNLEQVRGKKLHKFEDLDPMIRACLKEYGRLFPRLSINKRGEQSCLSLWRGGCESDIDREGARLARFNPQILCQADSFGNRRLNYLH